MKTNIIFIIILLININTVYSLNEEWYFNNLFIQYINPSGATLTDLQVSIIESIRFTEINSNNTSDYFKKASVRMIDENDIIRTYNCIYLDMGNVINLHIDIGIREISITLNIIRYTNGNIWYSYLLSKDLDEGIINSVSENDNEYLNLIGIIRRNR